MGEGTQRAVWELSVFSAHFSAKQKQRQNKNLKKIKTTTNVKILTVSTNEHKDKECSILRPLCWLMSVIPAVERRKQEKNC